MQSRSNSYYMPYEQRNKKNKRIRRWIILLFVLLIPLVATRLLSRMDETTTISCVQLTCSAGQNVTPFGDDVLYFENGELKCTSSSGASRWSYFIGYEGDFSCSDRNVIAWTPGRVVIINRNGNATYSNDTKQPTQFARISDRYAAIVSGDDTAPHLKVIDLNGGQIDDESEAFSDMMLLDVGFFGDQGQYMWTLSLDVYGTAINTVMHTFQVGKMNAGQISLGNKLCYKVLYDNKKLRAFTTQQLHSYDYKCVQDTNASILIYGWEYIDSFTPSNGDATILMARSDQTSSSYKLSDLRVLCGTSDRRFTLPAECVGAAVYDNSLYAFSGTTIYRTDTNNQRYYPYSVPLPETAVMTEYLGKTTTGKVLLASGEAVYAVTLPRK